MTNRYRPSVLIGLGGTGVRALRFIQSIADYGIDKHLQEALANDSMRLLGIDTDSRANAKLEPLADVICGTEHQATGPTEQLPSVLSLIPDFHLVPRETINNALPGVIDSLTAVDAELDKNHPDLDIPHKRIAKWFPMPDPESGDQITAGQARSQGAAQWRPLGRMALFLNARDIVTRLQASVEKVDPRKSGAVDIYIISSLAGGTGSGMFWDICFLIRHFYPKATVTGSFLLAEAFSGFQGTERIRANAYAALKELSSYKNLLLEDPLLIDYPIGENGLQVEFKPRQTTLFDNVYLFQGFAPPKGARDERVAKLYTTCLRIAQNTLAQLRTDVEAALGIGKDNELRDTDKFSSDKESRFIFSTSGATQFFVTRSDDISNSIAYDLISRYAETVRRTSTEVLSNQKLWEMLQLEGEPVEEPSLDQWVASVETWWTTDKLSSHATTIDGALAKISRMRSGGFTNKEVEEQLADIRQLGKDLFGKEQIDHWAKNPDASIHIPGIRKHLEKNIRKRMEEIVEQMLDLPSKYADNNWMLSAEMDRMLDSLMPTETGYKGSEISGHYAITPPLALKNVREFFFDPPPRNLAKHAKRALTSLTDRHQPLDALESGLKSLREELNKIEPLVQDARLRLVRHIFAENRDKVAGLADRIRKSSNESKRAATRKEGFLNFLDGWLKRNRKFGSMGEALQATLFNHLRRADVDRYANGTGDAESHNRRITHLLTRIAEIEFHRDINGPKFADDHPLVEETVERYNKLVFKTIDPTLTRESREAYLDFIASIAGNPLGALHRDKDGQSFCNYISSLIDIFVRGTFHSGNSLADLAGGEEGISRRLDACKSFVFKDSATENRLQKKNLVIITPNIEEVPDDVLPPTLSSPPSKAEEREDHSTFQHVASRILHVADVTIPTFRSNAPVIYFEDRFHAANEIDGIYEYFREYEHGGTGRRSLFHIVREAVRLPEIVSFIDKPEPIHCGNSGCRHDLRKTPATQLICPGCKRPIWNRCGNPGCTEDNLAAKVEAEKDAGNPVPHRCPTCTKPMLTYWWHCKDPEHSDASIPMDKESCDRCQLEYEQGIRPLKEVHRRPDLTSYECPGCPRTVGKQHWDVVIPKALTPYFNNGVNGHDSRVFFELCHQHRLDPHVCRNEQETHFLFPTCPVDIKNPHKRHHLYRHHSGRFVCSRHGALDFHTCAHCGYPIHADDEKLVNSGATKCPRCLRTVQWCDGCSSANNLLFHPIDEDSGAPSRCPNCLNLMSFMKGPRNDKVDSGLKKPAFCRNIYHCNAASHIWHTATEELIRDEVPRECACCTSEQAAILLPLSDLEEHILKCPLCLSIVGLPSSMGHIGVWNGEQLTRHFNKILTQPQKVLPDYCKVCGADPLLALGWAHESGYLTTAGEAREGEASIVDPIRRHLQEHQIALHTSTPFNQALEILQVLHREINDFAAFEELRRSLPIDCQTTPLDEVKGHILRVFNRNFVTARALESRLEEVVRINSQRCQKEDQIIGAHTPSARRTTRYVRFVR